MGTTTGVVAPGMERTVKASADFIGKLQPDLRRLVVVSGASVVDRRWDAAARNALRSEGRFEVSFVSQLHGFDSKPRRQNSIESRGRTAAL